MMKRTLVAVAALAATSAFAQSSVTISGSLYGGLNQYKSATGLSTTSIGNGPAASRLRFVGSEDMGGGMRANFQLEMQPNLGNGAISGNGLFNRAAWVGLSGAEWGAVRLGRQSSSTIGVLLIADQGDLLTGFNGGGILFNGSNNTGRWMSANASRGINQAGAGSGGMAASSGGPTGQDVTRVINAVTYLSPNFSGLTAQLQYALGNLANNAVNGQGNTLQMHVAYNQGPISAGIAYTQAGADPSLNASGKLTTLAAAYNFGVARVGLGYQSESASGTAALYTSARAYSLTAVVPMGAFAPYVRLGGHKTNGLGAFGNFNRTDSSVLNLGMNYSLSKRTSINVDYARDSKGNSGVLNTGLAGAGSNNNNPSLLYAGLRHDF